jgi:hypothetical protein
MFKSSSKFGLHQVFWFLTGLLVGLLLSFSFNGQTSTEVLLYQPAFIPFTTIAGHFDDVGTMPLESCQQLVMSEEHLVDGYWYDTTKSKCWLVKDPLHPTAGVMPTNIELVKPPNGCEYVQVKPDRIFTVLLDSSKRYESSSLSALRRRSKHKLLSDAQAVKSATTLCRNEHNTVVVLIADTGNESFLRIWLHFWYEAVHTFRNVIIIAQDTTLYDKMDKMFPGQVLLEPAALLEFDVKSQPASFGSDTFSQRVKRRFYQVSVVAATGVNVIYSDIDVLLFCDLLAAFASSTQMLATLDKPNDVCSGLFYVPFSVSSLQVLMLADAKMGFKGSHNQGFFNFALKLIPVHFRLLPSDQYPTAKYRWDMMHKSATEAEALAQDALKGVCYLHNNWIVGNDRKRLRLQEYGLDQNPVTERHPGVVALRNGA